MVEDVIEGVIEGAWRTETVQFGTETISSRCATRP